uniref:Uncharacterized protein n=1 Tax=Anguilla anguilla TaxID=7936 RepID=A0A0E9QR06_ANGAN
MMSIDRPPHTCTQVSLVLCHFWY